MTVVVLGETGPAGEGAAIAAAKANEKKSGCCMRLATHRSGGKYCTASRTDLQTRITRHASLKQIN